MCNSERVSKVGNTSGERFREGVAINQSLQCLGHCIHALAESSSATVSSNGHHSGSKGQRIPFRDSVLTKLLMNALGGNSKTIMVGLLLQLLLVSCKLSFILIYRRLRRSVQPTFIMRKLCRLCAMVHILCCCNSLINLLISLADRAKQIRTRATVNEDPTEKLARDLKVENQRLKTILTRGNIDPQWMKNAVNGRSTNPQGPLSN